MQKKAKLVQIIRKIGAPEPPRIKLTGILESPEQDLFTFSFRAEDALCNILNFLGDLSINIRFLSKTPQSDNHYWARISTDPDQREKVLAIFSRREITNNISGFTSHQGVRIISLYPFKGNPGVAIHLYNTFHSNNVEILAISTASSVISCVIWSKKLPQARNLLKSAFYFS